MPGAYLPYGYGGAKFWGLREQTQSSLGDDFDPEEFHLQLLTNGPRPFQVVEEDLKDYVKSKGHRWNDKFIFFASERIEGMPAVQAQTGFFGTYGYTAAIAAVVVLAVAAAIILMKRERRKSEQGEKKWV